MKNHQTARSQRPASGKNQHAAPALSGSPFLVRNPQGGFTLIELLVVIAIIAVLAAFTIPVLKSVTRKKIIDRTQTEMAQLETAISSYQAAYGFYPPSNPNYNPANSATWNDAYYNPLYYELLGTTNDNPGNPGSGTYYTLDHSASIVASSTMSDLGVGGFINCSKSGADEDAPAAKIFLPDLKVGQYGTNNIDGLYVNFLLCSVGGPDQSYKPMGLIGSNPWRYVNPGVHNPKSYDLWVQLVIGGKTNLICNWNKEVQINSPLP
jgi:prepilin-type N-terminal cleavage/methylation domain-containing protein